MRLIRVGIRSEASFQLSVYSFKIPSEDPFHGEGLLRAMAGMGLVCAWCIGQPKVFSLGLM